MGGEFHTTNKDSPVDTPRQIRTNGLHTPYDPLQVLSWFIVTFLAGCFVGLLAPMIPSPGNIISLVTYITCLLVVLISGYITGRCDPIDPYVKATDEELDGVDDLLRCSVCVSRVNKLSRHCLVCDKCVVDYDHHCKWLNNCIGAANYRSFICLIVSTLFLVAMQLIASVVVLIKYVGDIEQLKSDLAWQSIVMDEKLYLAFASLNALLGLASCMMVAHLVSFHIYLAYHGLTTYNYVMQTQAMEEADRRKSADKYREEDSYSEEDSDEEDHVSDEDKAQPQSAQMDLIGGHVEDQKIIDVAPDPVVVASVQEAVNIPGQLSSPETDRGEPGHQPGNEQHIKADPVDLPLCRRPTPPRKLGQLPPIRLANPVYSPRDQTQLIPNSVPAVEAQLVPK